MTSLISKYCCSKYYVSCVRFASGNYLLKTYKWNKENVIITFRNYVVIILGSCDRLTLCSYAIKRCRGDKELRSNYFWKLREDRVTKIAL